MTEAFIDLYTRLRGYPNEEDPEYWDEHAKNAATLIREARSSDSEILANQSWHLAVVSEARATTCRLFAAMRAGDFRGAWDSLEHVEKMTQALERNAILEDDFGIRVLSEATADWQALYPYTVFASPEMIIRRQECTICDAPVSPLRPCGHLPGRVYAGAICSRRITECEPVSIALVRDPVQKYSVVIPKDDPHDYARVRFVLDRLRGPFSRWRLVKTTILHDHSLFDGWARDGNCPCHSGLRYSDCCALQPGVRLPHDQILFEEAPPPDLPQFLLRRRNQADGDLEDVTIAPRAA